MLLRYLQMDFGLNIERLRTGHGKFGTTPLPASDKFPV